MPNRSGDEIVVLHVDDEPDFAALSAAFLERQDERFTVETATTATDGLARLSGDVDCVVSDYEMPGMDGVEFLEAVRDEYPELPFILFTGGGSEAVASDAISAGVTDYLRKEVGTEQYAVLADRIRTAVDRYRDRARRRRRDVAIETAQEGISFLDEDGYYRYVNEAYADLYGYEPEELIGEHWKLLYPDDEIDYVRTEIVPAVEADGYWHGRTTGLRADGTTFPEDHVVSTTENSELICTVRDITEREKREQKLTRLHAATRDLVEAKTVREIAALATEAADDILEFPLTGIHLYDEDAGGLAPVGVSEASREVLGEPPVLNDGVAWDAYQRGEPQIYADVREADAVFNEETEMRSEMFLPLADHGVFIVSSTEVDAFDRTDITFAKLLAANVTSALDRTDHARKLELLQERTQTLMNTSTVDETGAVAVTAAREIFGAELSTFHRVTDDGQRLEPVATTDTVHDVFSTTPAYDRSAPADSVDAVVWEVFDGGEPIRIDDTSEHPILAGKTPARSAIVYPVADRGVFIVSSTGSHAFSDTDAKFTDILASTLTSALQRVERESLLRDRTDELEKQNERLDKFASVISHDLRNPLQVADGNVQLARETGEGDGEHLENAAWALDRMYRLIDDVLMLAREGDGIGELESVTLEDVSTDCWRSVATDGATLVTETDQVIRADRSRLTQLLENLFRNAVEHGSTSPASHTQQDAVEHGSTNPRSQAPEDAVDHGSTSPASHTQQDAGRRVASSEPSVADASKDAVQHGSTSLRSQAPEDAAEHGSASPDSHTRQDAVERAGSGSDVTVTVGALEDRSGFYVADDGPGIPEAERTKVLETGYSTAADGTGLGLSIVHEVADVHGWDLTVTCGEDGGARFEIADVDVEE